MIGARNLRGGLVLLSLGLAGGLAMSLYAFQPMVAVPASLAHYDDLPRRLIRLAHIAAIMLPLINVVLASWIDRLRLPTALKNITSWLLLLGAAGLPLTLTVEALIPPVIAWHLPALPAIGFSVGIVLVTAGACRMPCTREEAFHARFDRRGSQDEADRGRALQEAGG